MPRRLACADCEGLVQLDPFWTSIPGHFILFLGFMLGCGVFLGLSVLFKGSLSALSLTDLLAAALTLGFWFLVGWLYALGPLTKAEP